MALENDKPNEGDKSLSIFDTPADVEGTIFLSHTKIKNPDDQWLFLPALKRLKGFPHLINLTLWGQSVHMKIYYLLKSIVLLIRF